MKKIGPLVSLLLLLGIGYAVYDSLKSQALIEINGLIGSEKQAFFDDPRVKDRLKKLGFVVSYQKAGSRQIATHFNLSDYDYAFPAGLPAAEKIRRSVSKSKSYNPFFTPMAIASWKPIADILEENEIVEKSVDHYIFNINAYIDAFEKDTRWKDLQGNQVFAINRPLLVNSTDIRKSNSAAMYLSLASYALNDSNIVQSEVDANKVLPLVTQLFKKQGFIENSSAVPFEDYTLMGMGKAPLVMIYESQFIHRVVLNDGSIRDDMTLLYPKPSLFTKHVLIGLNENGQRFGELLENDEQLQTLAIEHGFRNRNQQYFQQFIKQHNIQLPSNLIDVVEPPSYEMVEYMIQNIEQQY